MHHARDATLLQIKGGGKLSIDVPAPLWLFFGKCFLLPGISNLWPCKPSSWSDSRKYLGTCESFFCLRIESAVRFDFESNFRIESAVYTTQAVTPSNELQGVPCRPICWRLALWTCVLCFSPKMRQTMPLYDYLTPKLYFKCKFNHRQSFLYKGRLTVRTIRKFRIGSLLRIVSGIGSSIRNRIESRSFAGP